VLETDTKTKRKNHETDACRQNPGVNGTVPLLYKFLFSAIHDSTIILTYFDAPDPNGAYVGIDTNGGAPPSTDKIRYYPRSGFTERMVGGVFEGTNGDPANGPYEAIYTISNNPAVAWSEANVDLKDYRHLRYRGPNGSYGNVAEIEFYRDGVKLTGSGFETPGSWNNQGNTLEKALDGNLSTYFDAPGPDGAYVGINAQ
jgi:hypothetical protein